MAQIIVIGEQVGAKSGEEMLVVNPVTEEEFDTVPKGGPEDVDAAVAAAKEALKEWSEENPDERAEPIRAGVSSIKENGKEIAQLLVQEQGEPMMETMRKLHHFLHGMSYYADLAGTIEGRAVYSVDPGQKVARLARNLPRSVQARRARLPDLERIPLDPEGDRARFGYLDGEDRFGGSLCETLRCSRVRAKAGREGKERGRWLFGDADDAPLRALGGMRDEGSRGYRKDVGRPRGRGVLRARG